MFKAMLQEGVRLTRGNSIWVFLLLGIEAIKTYRSNPFFEYDYPDPIQCTGSYLRTLLQHCLLQDPDMDDASRFDFCDLDTRSTYILIRPSLRTAGWLSVRTWLSQVPGAA
jgi:hypothetical protein